MSHSHKERHRWKAKERKRTNESDPVKIALHRERFLKRLEQKSIVLNGYQPIVFQSRLLFKLDEGTTTIYINNQPINELTFIVNDPESCHFVITQYKSDFNASQESQKLTEHINRVKHLGQDCHLALPDPQGQAICSSIIACKYRKISDQGLPMCNL